GGRITGPERTHNLICRGEGTHLALPPRTTDRNRVTAVAFGAQSSSSARFQAGGVRAELELHAPPLVSRCTRGETEFDLGVEKRQEPGYSWVMKLFIGLVLWCLLFLFSWPLAILALVIYPFLWLISIPLRLVGITVAAA